MSKIYHNLNLIAAVDQNWALGNAGELLFRIPEDLTLNFRAKTLGQIVIMGRATFESLPGKKPLPDRLNIVLSRRRKVVEQAQVLICNDLAALWPIIEGERERQIFVAGGASVYRQLLPYCALAYITRIMAAGQADRRMTDLEQAEEWVLAGQSPVRTYGDLRYYYATYKNTAK